ncbi:hypothetical protein AN639_07440 [Candidatus Epulonipiscium fishelsonii]|uniref:Uncharacterized protein n=1 Tax=Candidatus Epulonipiscium fishelsonii TaxID=77094 RepID=A0ACC8XF50_9FIRM|nr:hypothetical protein AN639_07440 [Epulopiscium sp. SCG-B05WGA-EpuloA1]ONI41904.1 hypothetical protein AN396_02930 [Epulopiscium sp. SCG-B11WGA-EpuloA1]
MKYNINVDSHVDQIILTEEEIEKYIKEIEINIKEINSIAKDGINLSIYIPMIDIHGFWTPTMDGNRGFSTNYRPFLSGVTQGVPILALYSIDQKNKMTFSFSDIQNFMTYGGYIIEETSEYLLKIKLFHNVKTSIKDYKATIRLDMRQIDVTDSIRDALINFNAERMYVPKDALFPMYSTWYSYHQNITSESILTECKEAIKLGCKAIIVDDGWQTDDNSRGYTFCGDWEVCKSKIPDMRELVDKVHNIGMKFLLWYTVPLIGYKSKKWEDFKDKLLSDDYNKQGCGILDPRFKEVREYLIQIYIEAVNSWNFDGLKLDFIDCFKLYESSKQELEEGMDYLNVQEATAILLKDLTVALQKINPEIMIEFRQRYIGPIATKYSNMVRAVDCPNDPIINRIRILDLKLATLDTAVHSDMVTWNYEDTDDSVAIQLYNTLFSVPQISVKLNEIKQSHYEILQRFNFSVHFYHDLLVKAPIKVNNIEAGYSQASVCNDHTFFCAVYQNGVVTLPEDSKVEYVIINVSYMPIIVINGLDKIEFETIKIISSKGKTREVLHTDSNRNVFNVKPADMIIISTIFHI